MLRFGLKGQEGGVESGGPWFDPDTEALVWVIKKVQKWVNDLASFIKTRCFLKPRRASQV